MTAAAGANFEPSFATAPGKYLVIGPAWIGDMVMAQSLFRQLKANHPDNEVQVMAPAWTRPLLARMPEVARGIDSPSPMASGTGAGAGESAANCGMRASAMPSSCPIPSSRPWFPSMPAFRGGPAGAAKPAACC